MSKKEINNKLSLVAEPSPRDDRDWIAESIYPISTVYPKKLDLRNDLQPIRNQGSSGTCLAQSGACMKEWQEKKDINFNDYMSPQFIYNLRENSGEGMYGRDLMRILSKIGVCYEEDYEYGKEESKEKVIENVDVIGKANNFKIKNYARINTIDSAKKSLFQNGPCVICFPVYNHGIKMWKAEKIGQKIIGGHAMTIVGYTKTAFIIRNSWGEDWGEQGYCYYPFNEWGSHWEIWTTIDAKSTVPKSNKFKWWCF